MLRLIKLEPFHWVRTSLGNSEESSCVLIDYLGCGGKLVNFLMIERIPFLVLKNCPKSVKRTFQPAPPTYVERVKACLVGLEMDQGVCLLRHQKLGILWPHREIPEIWKQFLTVRKEPWEIWMLDKRLETLCFQVSYWTGGRTLVPWGLWHVKKAFHFVCHLVSRLQSLI